MAPQRPGAYDPRPSSRASNRNNKAIKKNENKAPPKLPAELTAAAISKKTPEWFHISGIPVRPLTARETRRAPPTSNKGRTLKPKTQVQIQKEKMVGTSSNNPHYFRLPYKRKQVGQGGEKNQKKEGIENQKSNGNRPPTAPSAGARKPVHKPTSEQVVSEEERKRKNAKVHYTRYYEQKNIHQEAPSPKEIEHAMKLRSVISHDMPDWMQIPQVPVIHPSWKTKDNGIVVKEPPPFVPPVNLKEQGSTEACVSEAAPTWMHIDGVPKKPYRKPEALSVQVSFNNAASDAFGQKHPVNFHYLREPHKQHVDQEHKREYTDCGNFHKYISHHSAVSAKAPPFFHVNQVPKAKVVEYHHQKGAHMRNMRPTTSGGVHEHPNNWRKSVSSVSYDSPDWMKTYQTHIVNGPVDDMKMIAGKNNDVLVPKEDAHKLAILKAKKQAEFKKYQEARKYAASNPPYNLLAVGHGERHNGLQAPRSRKAAKQAVPRNRPLKSNLLVRKLGSNKFVPQRPPSRARNPITGVGTNRYPTKPSTQIGSSNTDTKTNDTELKPQQVKTVKTGIKNNNNKNIKQSIEKMNSNNNNNRKVDNISKPTATSIVPHKPKPPSSRPQTASASNNTPSSAAAKDALIHRLRSELNALKSRRSSSRGSEINNSGLTKAGKTIKPSVNKGSTVVNHGAGSNSSYHEKMVLV
jgi:hypothetical protein